MKNSNDNNGLKNTATIDVNYYNELIEKKRLLDEYFDDKSIIFKDSWNTNYKALTNDETVKELGSIFNEKLKNSINIQMYDELKQDYKKLKNQYDDLKKDYNKLKDIYNNLECEIHQLIFMSTKKFKKWKKKLL